MDIYYFTKKQKKLYKSLVKVYSPALKSNIYFTDKGFRHLLYDHNRKYRSSKERYTKLLLLNHVKDIVISTFEIDEIRVISESRDTEAKIKHYSLVKSINLGLNVRVVIEKRTKGKYVFLSIMLKH